MNNKSFPITIYTWKNNFYIDILGDLFLGFDAMWFLVILLLPFFIVAFILKTIIHFKYEFHEDKIISYNIFGFKKIINKKNIRSIILHRNDRSIYISWKKDRRDVTKRITITQSSLKNQRLELKQFQQLLTSHYL